MQLVLGDIAQMETDAIVVPAHSDLKRMPGIRDAVFGAADTRALERACEAIGRCRMGHAVVTPSCGLPSRYIIHVAGPGWYGGHKTERILFADCYNRALHKAQACQCRTLALPLMFSGGAHLPRAQALEIVCRVVLEFERTHTAPAVTLVLYKEGIFHLAEAILRRVEAELSH